MQCCKNCDKNVKNGGHSGTVIPTMSGCRKYWGVCGGQIPGNEEQCKECWKKVRDTDKRWPWNEPSGCQDWEHHGPDAESTPLVPQEAVAE